MGRWEWKHEAVAARKAACIDTWSDHEGEAQVATATRRDRDLQRACCSLRSSVLVVCNT